MRNYDAIKSSTTNANFFNVSESNVYINEWWKKDDSVSLFFDTHHFLFFFFGNQQVWLDQQSTINYNIIVFLSSECICIYLVFSPFFLEKCECFMIPIRFISICIRVCLLNEKNYCRTMYAYVLLRFCPSHAYASFTCSQIRI